MNSDCMECRKKQWEYSVCGKVGTCAYFLSTSLSLSAQLLFQQLGLALLSCQSQLSAVLLRALWTHHSLPWSQPILPWLLLGHSVVGHRKGSVPADHYAHISQSLKIRHTETVETRQIRSSASVPNPLYWALPWWLTSSYCFEVKIEAAEAQDNGPWLPRRELRAVWKRGWRPWSPAQRRTWQCTGQRRTVVPPGLNGAFKVLCQQHCAATQHSQKGWLCSWGTWKAHVQAAKQLLRTEHQPVLFIKYMLTKKIGINFVHIKKIQFQFFLLHNLGTWASVRMRGQRMMALSTPLSLWHQKEMKQMESKKPNTFRKVSKWSKQTLWFCFTHTFQRSVTFPNTLCPFLMPINQLCLALCFDRSRNKKIFSELHFLSLPIKFWTH